MWYLGWSRWLFCWLSTLQVIIRLLVFNVVFEVLNLFLFFRGNSYCDKRKQKCKQKKNPGMKCKFHTQCQSSICLESHKEALAQKGNNQDFGFGCVLIIKKRFLSFSQIFHFFSEKDRNIVLWLEILSYMVYWWSCPHSIK